MKKIFIILFIFLITKISLYANTIIDWNLLTDNAQYTPRALFASTVYGNKLWIMGGRDNLLSLVVQKDVWSSLNGIDWELNTGNAEFGNREGACALNFDGKLWIIGGTNTEDFPQIYFNDVWYSTDGIEWVAATRNAEFAPRTYFTSLVYDNKMWVIGGMGEFSILFNDAWYSTDGIEWIAATQNAEFVPRAFLSSSVYNSKMWVVSGATFGFVNDVWYSTDGIEWVAATRNAEWGARDAGNLLTYNNKLYFMAGHGDAGGEFDEDFNDLWSSVNGVIWQQESGGYTLRQEGQAIVFDEDIYIFGGLSESTLLLNDVWVSIPSKLNIIDYWSSIWSGRIYEATGNTYMAMRKYNYSIKRTPVTVTANDQQNIFYRIGLMLIKKFKSLTSYDTNIKTISRISNVSTKATAQANFVATMTPVYTLLPEADTYLSRGLNVTKATKDTIKINQGKSYINYVATYVSQ